MKNLIAILLLAPSALAADLAGRFESNTKYEAPVAHAPASVSRMFARTIPRAATIHSIDLPATGGSGMIIWTIPARSDASAGAIRARLMTPNGSVLQPSDRGSMERGLRRFRIDATETAELGLPSGSHDVMHVMRTVAAAYRLDVEMPEDVGGVLVVAAEPNSAVTLSTWAAPLSRQPGEPITLHAELRDGDSPITGARVTARLASPNGRAFEIIDLAEESAGVYSATMADLPDNAAGAWQVRFEAEGETAAGVRFARTGGGELIAERGAARLGDPRVEVVGDVVRVSAPADVALRGSYRFDVIAAREGLSLAWAEGVRQLEVGSSMLTLDIPLADVGGTFHGLFLDVRLLGLDPMGVAGRVTAELK